MDKGKAGTRLKEMGKEEVGKEERGQPWYLGK